MTITTPSREELDRVAGGNPRVVRFFEQLAESAQKEETITRVLGVNGVSDIGMGGIPEWAREITITFSGVGLPDTADFIVQVGGINSSGLGFYNTSGYFSAASLITGATVGTASRGDGFNIRLGSTTEFLQGFMKLVRLDGNSGARWIASHTMRAGLDRVTTGAGRISVTTPISQARVLSTSGSVCNSGVIGFEYRR
jgi:hypothetical protein